MIIIPIGRDSVLTKFPWTTVALMLLNAVAFLWTWPEEKRFLSFRQPRSPLVVEARALADLALGRGTTLPAEIRSRLEDERSRRDFPSRNVDDILQSIQKTFDYLPPLWRKDWDLHFEAYQLARKDHNTLHVPWESIFSHFGFRSTAPPWPGLLTHIFLHVGILHLFLNMLFLWLVGCNVEERWGPFIFLFLYFTGGVAAAYSQAYMVGEAAEMPMVGASGAIAAIMGAFLVRHYKMPINLFYWIFFSVGKISAPAWVVLPLWFVQQVFMGLVTGHQLEGGVAHWAHAGGFLYGVLLGLIIRRGKIASSWEHSADTTPVALDQRAEDAWRLFDKGERQTAMDRFASVLKANPRHLRALSGLAAAQEHFEMKEESGKTAVLLIHSAIDQGRGQLAEEVFRRWGMKLFQSKLPAAERLMLAQTLEKMHLWREALAYYRSVTEEFRKSTFAGKALYAMGKIMRDHLNKPEEAVTYFKALMDKPFDMEWSSVAEAELRAMGKF